MPYLLYLAAIVILAALDYLWIGIIARPWYAAAMGPLLSSQPIWWAAGAFYLLYAAGLCYFVINPSIEARSLLRALFGGLFFGLIAYATYDLTNIATTTGWPVDIAFLDMAWGAFAGGVASTAAYLIAVGVLGM